MTDQEINVAIAEHLGRAVCRTCGGDIEAHDMGCEGLPNYANDLNAMHEAEEWLLKQPNKVSQWRKYGEHLNAFARNEYGESTHHADVAHIKARQRAEAFLRTVGKWKEQTT